MVKPLMLKKSLNVNIAFCQNDPFLENVFGQQFFFLQTADEGTQLGKHHLSLELPMTLCMIFTILLTL